MSTCVTTPCGDTHSNFAVCVEPIGTSSTIPDIDLKLLSGAVTFTVWPSTTREWWRGIEGARELDCVCRWRKWPASWKPQEQGLMNIAASFSLSKKQGYQSSRRFNTTEGDAR
jgi:hypothetical protein